MLVWEWLSLVLWLFCRGSHSCQHSSPDFYLTKHSAEGWRSPLSLLGTRLMLKSRKRCIHASPLKLHLLILGRSYKPLPLFFLFFQYKRGLLHCQGMWVLFRSERGRKMWSVEYKWWCSVKRFVSYLQFIAVYSSGFLFLFFKGMGRRKAFPPVFYIYTIVILITSIRGMGSLQNQNRR